MSRVVVLDATPLGLLCHPNPRGDARDCARWANALRIAGATIYIPEVADYEVRRELIRARRLRALSILDGLHTRFDYLAITTDMMRLAAQLWAQSRQAGLPTAGARELDADAIVAAQTLSLNDPSAIVATSNPAHLSRFVRCDLWQNIPTS